MISQAVDGQSGLKTGDRLFGVERARLSAKKGERYGDILTDILDRQDAGHGILALFDMGDGLAFKRHGRIFFAMEKLLRKQVAVSFTVVGVDAFDFNRKIETAIFQACRIKVNSAFKIGKQAFGFGVDVVDAEIETGMGGIDIPLGGGSKCLAVETQKQS